MQRLNLWVSRDWVFIEVLMRKHKEQAALAAAPIVREALSVESVVVAVGVGKVGTPKPPQYIVLDQALKRDLPTNSPPRAWSKLLISGSAAVNMGPWNSLRTYGTVRRI